jgi:hypothetical protein
MDTRCIPEWKVNVMVKVPRGRKRYKHCYERHLALDVGGGRVIYGGNCWKPVINDADVYVGFDDMSSRLKSYPWEPGWNPDREVAFPIEDRTAPENPEQFRNFVCWVSDQLDAKMKVHCGCVGGHGRTGMFFAALVSHRLKLEDPIGWVREKYCKEAVESKVQVDFLVKNWGYKYPSDCWWDRRGLKGSVA